VSALGYLRRTPLLAWAFAYAYAACDAMLPGSFSAPIDPTGPRSWMGALVMLESFAGVMYMALVVSRLVGLTMLRRDRT